MKKPVDWDELYPNRFLKAGELGEKKVTLTIRDVNLEELIGDNGPKIKGAVSFDGTPNQLPLNNTNGTCHTAMFGRKVPGWVGKRITLFADKWNGEPAVRVWGSPDLEEDKQITVALPRRRPIPMVMHAVRPNGQRQQQARTQARQPARNASYEDGPLTDDGEPPADYPLPGQEREPGSEG